ncbi:site-specific integrase [Alistipes putredinis]|uniref:site-specific integrase n=1 Tax=Alistipes putredinis TaxID=28117 RepID=UPI002AC3602F|nr:site-specific integrase [Alistipes putredinis]
MNEYEDFARCVEKFFMEYLVKERGTSHHTIRSYRDTLVLFITYMQDKEHVKAENLSFYHINRKTVMGFLNWLHDERRSSASTRNQRYAAIRSFFRFMICEDPKHMSQWKDICTIRLKRASKKSISYLTIDAVKYLLEQIPKDTKHGRRDMTLLALMYHTGARVQEIIDLTPESVRTSKPYTVELLGKGTKRRIVPIEDGIMQLLMEYMEEQNLNSFSTRSRPLFSNCWGEKLTTTGMTYILQKYVSIAKIKNAELFPGVVSPHVLRHSRAMHLLQAGVNLIYIRDMLGHVSIQTTEIYAKADSKLKREALEKAYENIGTPTIEKSWEKDPKLKAFLKGLV